MTRTIAGIVGVIVAATALLEAQSSSAPRNDLPQPYKTTRDWGQLPPGREVGGGHRRRARARRHRSTSIHRCFANSCAGRTEAPILKYDAERQAAQEPGARACSSSRTAPRWTATAISG